MPVTATTHRRTESADATAATRPDYRGEHVTLHNHDRRSGYGVGVRIVNEDGEPVTDDRYVVGSQTTKRAFDLCPAGEYTVEVFHAGRLADAVTCRLDESAAGTAVVECGNGVVSVTTGGR